MRAFLLSAGFGATATCCAGLAAWLLSMGAPPAAEAAMSTRSDLAPRGHPDVLASVPRARSERTDLHRTEVVIPRKGPVLRGRVVDRGGVPVDDLELVCRAGSVEQRVRSGPAGRFSLPVPDRAVLQLSIHDEAWTLLRTTPLSAEREQLVVVAPLRSCRGRVLDSCGAPVPGASVVAAMRVSSDRVSSAFSATVQPIWSATVADGGRFVFEALPDHPELCLMASAPGHRSVRVPVRDGAEIRLLRGALPWTVRGHVVGPDGEARAGARVQMGTARTRSGPAGDFELRCDGIDAADALVAIAEGPVAAAAWIDGFGACFLEDPTQVVEVHLDLEGSWTVRVVDANGIPLGGRRVRALPAPPGATAPAHDGPCLQGVTDGGGEVIWAGRFPASWWRVQVSAVTGGARWTTVPLDWREHRVLRLPGEDAQGSTRVPAGESGAAVLLADGGPAAGAKVEIAGRDGDWERRRRTRTSTDGRLVLPEGELRVRIDVAGHLPWTADLRAGDVRPTRIELRAWELLELDVVGEPWRGDRIVALDASGRPLDWALDRGRVGPEVSMHRSGRHLLRVARGLARVELRGFDPVSAAVQREDGTARATLRLAVPTGPSPEPTPDQLWPR